MSSTSRDVVRRLFVAVLGVACASCDRRPAAVATDSTHSAVSAAPVESTTTPIVGSGWNADAGPYLVLPTVDGGLNAGSFLRPESTELTVGDTVGVGAAIGNGQIELFSRGGKITIAQMTLESAPKVEQGCTAWPVARLAVERGKSTAPWTAAFAAGRVASIALDSIEGLVPRDSARLAIDLTRLASGLRDDTIATFRGLPFVVLHAWRSKGLPTEFVVATLARRVNQEDSPKEERLVIVVDQTGADPRQWTVAWHERASGHEDELVVAEPLLAFRLRRGNDVHLLFGRDDGVALGAAILTRGPNGWRVLWESAVAGCD